ncbi:ElaB/YqjD/DUF883 family membrane-anchored ribosome-binding protein [Saonia flava]|uniref:ElaB/YqjD/DUF883 family membrane-anchored ribosome-binding protein n=1 Tax=Saonia flava TaxID=523696 RepID=A0A846QUA3_9FLAO|nr:hypothetical protein [Saonia flava]NJB71618.1 ElaB/YqjD/DUF883 family membrane-anchored ribosome-binding protein [Saonia flava]
MAKKGKEKNTANKAKHTKLLNRKKNKIKKEKELRKERLKAIVKMSKEKVEKREL